MCTNAIILSPIALDNLGRAICGSVIDDDELKIGERLIQNALNRLLQIRFPIVDRHEKTHARCRLHLLHLYGTPWMRPLACTVEKLTPWHP